MVEKFSGKFGFEYFRMIDGVMFELKDGEVFLCVCYIFLDVVNCVWMYGVIYCFVVEVNSVMVGGVIVEVVSFKVEGFLFGDIVFGDIGW